METPAAAAQYFKQLTIIYLAMLIGQVSFCGIAYFMIASHNMQPTIHEAGLLTTGLPIAGIAAVAASYYVFRQRLNAVVAAESAYKKLELYRSALVLKFAIIETITLLAIVLHMLSGELVCLIVAALLVGWFAMQYPAGNKCLEDMGLDELALQEWEDGGRG